MASPSSRRAIKRRRSSITELAFHGIHTSRLQSLQKSEKCNPCVRYEMSPMSRAAQMISRTVRSHCYARRRQIAIHLLLDPQPPHVIPLPDRHAAGAQDVVGGG